MIAPSSEEFARWREDGVTRWVFQALEAMAGENRAMWDQHSWDSGHCNPLLLKELRTRADAYRALIETPYEAYCETNGDEPTYDQR